MPPAPDPEFVTLAWSVYQDIMTKRGGDGIPAAFDLVVIGLDNDTLNVHVEGLGNNFLFGGGFFDATTADRELTAQAAALWRELDRLVTEHVAAYAASRDTARMVAGVHLVSDEFYTAVRKPGLIPGVHLEWRTASTRI